MKHVTYLLLLVFLYSCGNKPQNKQAELAKLKKQQAEIAQKIETLEAEIGTKDSTRTIDVSAIAIAPAPFTTYIQVQGTIDADENVTANAEMGGVITNIYVKAGQQVHKGQVLVQLDNKAMQQQIAQAESQVQLTNTLYERQKNLWDQKIGTEVQYLQAKTNHDVAQRQLSTLKAQASMYRMVSPIDGTVDQMDLKIGQAIQPGMQGLRIVNLNKLKVKAGVAESYAGMVSQGDRVLVKIPDAADSVNTTISYASKVIDPSSRSFNIEVRLPAKKNLKPNMTAVLNIVGYKKADAISVPLKAIQKTEQGTFVFIADGNKAKKADIKVGNTYGGKTEVLSGLKTGDKVIVEGAQDLEEGDQVNIVE